MNDGFFYFTLLCSNYNFFSLLTRPLTQIGTGSPAGRGPSVASVVFFSCPLLHFLSKCSLFCVFPFSFYLFTYSFLPHLSFVLLFRIALKNPWHFPPFMLFPTPVWHCDLTYLTMLRASFAPFISQSIPCHALIFLVVFPFTAKFPRILQCILQASVGHYVPLYPPSSPPHTSPLFLS